MDVTATAATSAQTSSAAQGTSLNAGITADFQTFLTLLTSQLRNQDPLKPMESTQFVAQLATFSSVEQQVMSNEKLDTLVASLRASDAAALSGWIDREVETMAPARYSGEAIDLHLDRTPAFGDRLVVRDALGEIVSDQPYSGPSWNGTVAGGLEARDGTYTFELRSSQASGDALLETARTSGIVTEARLSPDGAELSLSSGQRVTLDQIAALR